MIRKATYEDINNNLLNIYIDGFKYHLNGRSDIFSDKSEHDLKEDLLKTINEENILVIENDIIIGYAVYEIKEKRQKTIWLDQIVIDKYHRHKGYGKLLMDKIKEIAKNENCVRIEFSCWSFNENAINMYKHLGFEEQKIIFEMKINNWTIRKKQKSDCEGVQKVITLAWQQTYKGIINDEYLNALNLNEKQRIENSINVFDENNNNELVLEIDNKIVGFVKYSESKDGNFLGHGEINALYLLKEYKGKGYGKLLFDKAKLELKKMGYFKIIVGCLDGNISNNFYKHMNGKFQSTRIFSRDSQDLIENIYLFDNN